MPSISDKDFSPDWVVKAQRGEEAAQREIYLHFAPQVYQLARHILQCDASAEEVVQDCFIDVLCKIDSFRHQGSFAGWLRRMAVNHSLMVLRSAWLKKRQSISDIELIVNDEEKPIDHAAARTLNTIFASLPAQTRAVLWLHDVEGYTHGEIAKFMGKSVSFSKSQLTRAHDKIRQQLNRQAFTGDADTKLGAQSCMPLLNNC
jgi:RNA polymerase sigma-70 factor (ECF subfamily)